MLQVSIQTSDDTALNSKTTD